MLAPRPRRAVLVVLIAMLAMPAGASASALLDVIRNIQQNIVHQKGTGIDACAFTTKQLNDAYGQIPIDEQQYSPALGRAIKAALQAHGSGACDKKPVQQQQQAAPAPSSSSTTGTPSKPTPSSAAPSASTAPPAAAPTPEPPPTPVALRAHVPVPVAAFTVSRSQAGTPAALIALAAATTLLGLLALAIFAVRRLGLDPRWTRPLRHAFAEAGWRSAGTWEDFTDWLRLGR